MESGWMVLPEDLLPKVLEALQAAEQCAPQDGGWGGCKAPATVRLVSSGWKCRHDAMTMRLLLRQEANAEGRACWRGRGSLDLKCYCFNALTDEGMRAVSSLTAFTSLGLWGCSKVTDVGLRTVRSLPALASKRYNTPV
jgi:hypothetical protein